MRKKNNFSTTHSSLQAPKLSRVLLCLFATAIYFCIFGASLIFIYYYFNNTISDFRRQMNGAAYNAQRFFYEREHLLQSMVSATILVPENHHSNEEIKSIYSPELSLIRLNSDYVVLVTLKDQKRLELKNTQLIYTSVETGKTTTIIPTYHHDNTLETPVEIGKEIIEFLSRQKWETGHDEKLPIVWFSSSSNKEERLYIFSPVQQSGWLGLTFPDLKSSMGLSTLQGGGYDLIDPQGRLVNISGLNKNALGNFIAAPFGVAGGSLIPDYLVLQRNIGQGGWSLVYFVPVSELIRVNIPAIQIVIIIVTILTILISLSFCYLSRKVLQPALRQFSALADSEALNRKLVETAPVGLAMVRKIDGELIFYNELAQGWIQNDESWFTRIAENNKPSIMFDFVLQDGRVIQLSYTQTFWGGEVTFLCVLNDISRLKNVEKSLVDAKKAAESANKAKTLFLTTMSHEIRTPLYGMMGALELLSLSVLNRQQSEYMKTLLLSSSSLLRIVNDSLDISTIEAGRLTLEENPFSPMELAELVIETYAAKAENKGLIIYTISETSVPHFVLGDVTRVRQILDNLVNNAVKFTLSGHVILRVNVVQSYDKKVRLVFNVIDTGIGIAPDHLPKLFDPYFRSGNKFIDPVSGSGLGLSICSRLVQLMGGKLSAISEPGLGTRFAFEVELSLAFDDNLPSWPSLLPVPVYVDGAVREIVYNHCKWLRRWGAKAIPYYRATNHNIPVGLLIQTWPPSAQTLDLNCRRIIALPPMLNYEKKLVNNNLMTGAYSVIGIGRLVQSIQQNYEQVPEIATSQMSDNFRFRVLVVDDSTISRIILRDQLELLGNIVVLAKNGIEAVNVVDALRIDVVITDLQMPFLDGNAVAYKLRNKGYKGMIIGLSGDIDQEENEKEKGAEMDYLLRKPLSLSQLRNLLRVINQRMN